MQPMAYYLRQPIALSIGLHTLVVALFSVGLPLLNLDEIKVQPLVVVDVVRTVPNTNLASSDSGGKEADKEQQETRKKPPPPPPPPPPPAKVVQSKPEPKTTSKAVKDAAEILPEKTVSAPVARPKPNAPQVKKRVVSAPASRPTLPKKIKPPTPKAKPNKLAQQSRQKQKADALNGVLQNLAEATQAKEAEENRKAQKAALSKKLSQTLTAAVGDAVKAPSSSSIMPLGISELDRLRAHISKFWAPPVGAKGASTLKVDIFVKLDRDGTVTKAMIEDRSRYNRDVSFRAAANAAQRAVLDASPLPLPADKYEFWEEFIFGFDPKNM